MHGNTGTCTKRLASSTLQPGITSITCGLFFHTETPSPGGTVQLSLACTPDEILLTVADFGIGSPAEGLPHLFKRFHRARNASTYPGNGLGLAIVEAIVGVHRGTVMIQSRERQGTTIAFSFPSLPK